MKGLLHHALYGKWDDPPKPLTEDDFVAALQPRHKDCNCPLCQMDKNCFESARAALFGKKEDANDQAKDKAATD